MTHSLMSRHNWSGTNYNCLFKSLNQFFKLTDVCESNTQKAPVSFPLKDFLRITLYNTLRDKQTMHYI